MCPIRTLVLTAVVGVFAFGSGNRSGTPSNNSASRGNSSADSSSSGLRSSGNMNDAGNMAANRDTSIQNDFWTQAAAGSLAEVELGKLAETRSQDADVKNFAEMMVRDHSAANDELKSIAQSKNIPLPNSLDPMHQTMAARLSGMTRTDFDREFMDIMLNDHEKTVQLFQSQADSGRDPDAKSFAAKNLPTLKQHLSAAQSLASKMK